MPAVNMNHSLRVILRIVKGNIDHYIIITSFCKDQIQIILADFRITSSHLLCLDAFRSISMSQYYEFHPLTASVIIGVMITKGELLQFHYLGKMKRYPI